jgi:acetyltransferase-like isoleucine patch superfamily enzyme
VRTFTDESLHPRKLFSKGPVVIEDDVLIGENVSILPGVRIGKASIIGAGAVVTKDIPPFSIAKGVPATSTLIEC